MERKVQQQTLSIRVPATSRAGTRDGSRFPFSHFSGIDRAVVWSGDVSWRGFPDRPLRDPDSRREEPGVAYAGRAINEEEPKYRFPAGLRKSQVLFNLNRAMQADGPNVIVVKEFFDVLKIHQSGRRGADGIFLLSSPVGTSAEPLCPASR